jgi:hypothetical protein
MKGTEYAGGVPRPPKKAAREWRIKSEGSESFLKHLFFKFKNIDCYLLQIAYLYGVYYTKPFHFGAYVLIKKRLTENS